jgi:sensor domain CHASE-containing protein
VDNKQFQKSALKSFTRLENGLVEVKEDQGKLKEELKQEIKFVHDDLNSKIQMIATAVKQLVEKMDTLVERMITKEEYERRFRDLETRIRELEQKIGQ